MTNPPKTGRCAIYTRKSSEEGLEQSFNSLHAQREACEAYVISQKHEGWQVLPANYDDGGFSGGNMERPGLKKLLADIGAGKIDTVVVYKVDRLTRSLSDFARIVESFDSKGVSFVSVTQQFNTTSSMGRLTLNVLLSFAQFEREVTGERIRDKVAASKRKGMWMGGHIPIGYDLRDRQLIVNDGEANTVRMIFAEYLRLGSVYDLHEELTRRDVRTKRRTCTTGRVLGGELFGRGTLYHLLSNPLYIGKIRHRGQTFTGRHEAIIDEQTWTQSQTLMRENCVRRRGSANLASRRPLLGLLSGDDGSRFTPSHASKKGRRYEYYVAQAADSKEMRRLPALETEQTVSSMIAKLLSNPLEMSHRFAGLSVRQMRLLTTAAQHKAEVLREPTSAEAHRLMRTILRSVTISRSELAVALDTGKLVRILIEDHVSSQIAEVIELRCAFEIARRGSEVRLVLTDGSAIHKPIPSLARAVTRAREWAQLISEGKITTMRELVAYSGLTKQYVRQILRLALLPSDLAAAIQQGDHPPTLTVAKLTATVSYGCAQGPWLER